MTTRAESQPRAGWRSSTRSDPATERECPVRGGFVERKAIRQAAAVISGLGRGCDLAACYPAPFEEAASRRPGDRDSAVAALGRVWAKLGFRHWRDGVWTVDLRAHDMNATLLDLLADRSRAAPDR